MRLKQNIIITLDDYLLSWLLRNCFCKKKKYKYNLGLKNHLLTLDNYLLSCGSGDGGTVGGGGGSGNSGSGSNCGGCDCCLL